MVAMWEDRIDQIKKTAPGVCALVNSMPRCARASMFGVLACGCPPSAPTQELRSSMAMNRTSGRSSALAVIDVPRKIKYKRRFFAMLLR